MHVQHTPQAQSYLCCAPARGPILHALMRAIACRTRIIAHEHAHDRAISRTHARTQHGFSAYARAAAHTCAHSHADTHILCSLRSCARLCSLAHSRVAQLFRAPLHVRARPCALVSTPAQSARAALPHVPVLSRTYVNAVPARAQTCAVLGSVVGRCGSTFAAYSCSYYHDYVQVYCRRVQYRCTIHLYYAAA